MNPMNIYLTGVGGQGIGLLSDVLALACVKAGCQVRACDTHALAQRGGTVGSHLRIGETLFGPRVPPGQADLVVGLERLEALRAARAMLKSGGSLIYYDAVYQPIHVRMKQADYPTREDVASVADAIGCSVLRVSVADLPDPRMQNVALIGQIASAGLVEGLSPSIFEQVLGDVLPSKILDANMAIFRKVMTVKR